MYSILKKINFLISKSQRKKLLVLTILLFVGMILEFLGLGLLIPVINILLDPNAFTQNEYLNSLRELFSDVSDQNFILSLLGFIVIFYLTKTCFLVLLAFKQNRFLSFLNASISNKLFSSYLNQPYEYHLKVDSSNLVKNLQIEVGYFFTFITSFMNIFIEGGLILSVFVTLIFIEPFGTLVLSLFLLLLTLIFYKLTKTKLDLWGQNRQQLDLNSAKIVTEGLGAIRDLIISGRINFYIKRFNNLSFNKARITSNHILFTQLPRFYFELASISGLVLFIVILILTKKSTTALVATLGVFVAGVFRALPSLNRLVTSIQNLKFYNSSVDIIYNELLSFNSVNKKQSLNQRVEFQSKISLENVTFKYGDKTVLEDISFDIFKNQSIGIIGESGAGKSTLVDLIVGLQKPNRGKILIDDIDLNVISEEWMSNIGYISQNIFLVNDTIENNIALGISQDQISSSRINQIIDQVQLTSYINDLPNGIKTKVGERGIQISGGQKQRIGIARALYLNPEILILDEATSALDNETEESILNLIELFKKTKTIIIISHNIHNLKFCDKIYRIENKKITNYKLK
jgi:ATP-binding cassette, subfamily B, bacterial PglK